MTERTNMARWMLFSMYFVFFGISFAVIYCVVQELHLHSLAARAGVAALLGGIVGLINVLLQKHWRHRVDGS